MSAPCAPGPSIFPVICYPWRPILRWADCQRPYFGKPGFAAVVGYAYEVRQAWGAIEEAARKPAYNVNPGSLRALLKQIRDFQPILPFALSRHSAGGPCSSHVDEICLSRMFMSWRAGANCDRPPLSCSEPAGRPAPAGSRSCWKKSRWRSSSPLRFVYQHCHRSLPADSQRSAGAARRRREIIDLGMTHRGTHDEMLRPFRAGQGFRFDILMDIGGFRDMHRHRRCMQIMQGLTLHATATTCSSPG